jgi:hypothetical protein
MPSSTAHWVQRRDAKQTWRIWLLPAIAELLGGGFAPRNKNVRSARRAISRRSALLNHNQRHPPPARDMKAVRLRHLASSRIEGGNHDRRDIQSRLPQCRSFVLSRPRRVASFQSRLLPLGNKPEQMWTVSTRNLLDSLLWSGLPGEKSKLKVRAGRAGGSHHKARHCWCDGPRSRWRGGRRRCVGRRHLPHRSFVSERSFKPQGVHWALGFYCHKL